MEKTIPQKEFPDRITLELTNRCNLSCTMCPRHHMTYPLGDMDSNLFKRLVDEMVDQGTKILVPFFRGESVLHPQFIELVTYAKRTGLEIQMATNGSLLTPELAAELVDINIDFISFSVDTIDDEKYRQVRRGGNLPRLLEGIETFINNKKLNLQNTTVVQISSVDTGFLPGEKQAFIDFWAKKVNRVRIYPRHTLNGAFGSLGENKSSERSICRKPFEEMVVYWDGQMASCNHDWNRTASLGNASIQSLSEIWNDERYREFRDRHHRFVFSDDEPCSNCDHWTSSDADQVMIGELYPGNPN